MEMKTIIILGKEKLMFSHAMVCYWELTKNLVNGGNLIKLASPLKIFQTSTQILLILDQFTCYFRSIEI